MPADQRGWFDDDQCAAPVEEASELGQYESIRSRGWPSFFLASWNKASCLRKNRFSAASAVRLRKPVPQKLMQSETTICNVTLSFESCRKMPSTWQWSHGYPLIRLPDHVFADHTSLVEFVSVTFQLRTQCFTEPQ